MTAPQLHQISSLVRQATSTSYFNKRYGWIPLRGIGYQTIWPWRRIKIAWGVFTGKYDAVCWEPDGPVNPQGPALAESFPHHNAQPPERYTLDQMRDYAQAFHESRKQ